MSVKLSPGMADVVDLRSRGFDVDEIVHILSSTRVSVHSLLYHARRRFRDAGEDVPRCLILRGPYASMPSPSRIDVESVRRLSLAGLASNEIASELSCSITCVCRHLASLRRRGELPPKHSKIRADVVRMHSKGMRKTDIAYALGVSWTTVDYHWRRANGLAKR